MLSEPECENAARGKKESSPDTQPGAYRAAEGFLASPWTTPEPTPHSPASEESSDKLVANPASDPVAVAAGECA